MYCNLSVRPVYFVVLCHYLAMDVISSTMQKVAGMCL